MKKLLSLILALVMVLSLTAVFAEGTEDADWTAADYAAHADIRFNLAQDYTGKTVILHSNDVHGQLDGYAYIAGLRTCFENLGAEVILTDSGDFCQGTIYVSNSKGSSAIEMMNAAKYDVVTLGNHDFDFSSTQLMDDLAKAKFAVICASVTDDKTGADILPASYTMTTAGGLKIAFVGVDTPETATKANPGLIRDVSFASFDKLAETTQEAVNAVRGSVDLVFGLWHLGVDIESKQNGYRSVDVFGKVTGFDMVLDGHSHTVMTAGQHGEPIQSTGTKFDYIGVVVIDNESKGIEDHFLIPTGIHSNLYTFNFIDKEVMAEADKIMKAVDKEFSTVFATSEVVLNGEKDPGNRTEETNLGDLVTDAIVWSVVKENGIEQVEPNAVVGITNGGGIRETLPEGKLTRKDINNVLPFSNTVAVVYVTGEQLLEALEASTFCTPDPIGAFPQTSGIEWTIDTTKPFDKGELYKLDGKDTSYYAPKTINRVTITAINGEPFDPKATYAVVTNNFCADGGDTYNVFALSSSSFDTGIMLDEAVIDYVTQVLGGKITAEQYGQPRGSITQIK